MLRYFSFVLRGYVFWVSLVALPCLARAHVVLDSPNGGQALLGGFELPIQWHPSAEHDTINWDLWYSATGPDGPWIEIAIDLPLGDPTAGAPHSFDWVVPNLTLPSAWVRVAQDNTGQDYYDVSSASFSISQPKPGDFTGNGVADGADLVEWESHFGTNSGALFPEGDSDFDGDVDGHDFAAWQRAFDRTSFLSTLDLVPEPASVLLLLIGIGAVLMQRRGN